MSELLWTLDVNNLCLVDLLRLEITTEHIKLVKSKHAKVDNSNMEKNKDKGSESIPNRTEQH